jgi:tetratricopeptide (TPR) repeat protein
MATLLKQLGFTTGAFVAAFPLDQRFGLNAGFDEYDDRFGEVVSSVDFLLPERRADKVVEPAMAWIARQNTKWFGWVHLFDPHGPYTPPQEWLARYPTDPYGAEVAWTDFVLGRLFDSLSRQSRPTLVIVTADHGEGLGQHGELTHGVFAYEATLRVPLIIAEIDPAGRETSGVAIASAARHVDLLPTVLDAVGGAPGAGLPGRSLRDVVRSAGGDDRPSYFESLSSNVTRGWAPLRGVIVGTEKFIDLPIPELYDLAPDPDEARNLLPTESERGRALAATLATFNTAPPGRPGQESAASRERLRALGYTGGSAPARDRYTEEDDPKRLVGLEDQLHLGTEAYFEGRLEEAAAIFEAVIAQRPDTDDAYRYLAYVYWQAGRPADAIGLLDRALQQRTASLETRVKLAFYLSETGRAPRAISLLEGVEGEDAEALSALGMAYANVGRFRDAVATFERVLDVDATSGLAHLNIGSIKLAAGDFAGAEASIARALDIDPALPGGYTAMGALLKKTGRIEQAIGAWRQAIDIDPREFDALYNLTFALAETGKTDEARQVGRRYVESAPPAL